MDEQQPKPTFVFRGNGKTVEGELIVPSPGTRSKAQPLPDYVGCPVATAARIRYVATITGVVAGLVCLIAGLVIGRFLIP